MTRAPVISDDDLIALAETFRRQKPAIVDDADLATVAQADSFAASAFHTGLGVRFRMRDGSETAMLLNPVLARHMLHCIQALGRDAGWLTDDLDVISPPRRPLDS